MLKYKIEGHSQESMDDALAQAMAKAAAFASEDHDMHIAVLELTVLPGRGFKAVVEVTIVPITLREVLEREAADVELKHIKEKDYNARKKAGETRVKKAVENHFLTTAGTTPDIPDVFLAHLDDAQLRNNLIEKTFYNMFINIRGAPLTTEVITEIREYLKKSPSHHIHYTGETSHELAIDDPELDRRVEIEFDYAAQAASAKKSPEPVAPESAPRAAKGRAAAPSPDDDEDF